MLKFKQKTMMGAMTDTAWFLDNLAPRQYMRNAMYLNTGTGRFMEAAQMLGIDKTNWSWAVKFADLDQDGRVDLFDFFIFADSFGATVHFLDDTNG